MEQLNRTLFFVFFLFLFICFFFSFYQSHAFLIVQQGLFSFFLFFFFFELSAESKKLVLHHRNIYKCVLLIKPGYMLPWVPARHWPHKILNGFGASKQHDKYKIKQIYICLFENAAQIFTKSHKKIWEKKTAGLVHVSSKIYDFCGTSLNLSANALQSAGYPQTKIKWFSKKV